MLDKIAPEELTVKTATATKTMKKIPGDHAFAGMNAKVVYQEVGSPDRYLMKVEKGRDVKDIFAGAGFFGSSPAHVQHAKDLRDVSTATSVIASKIAAKLFPECLRVPENHLSRLPDGTPAVLSKLFPADGSFREFLSKLAPFEYVKTSKHWTKQNKPVRAQLSISLEEAQILGTLYYVGLLMGHWDLFNNINLTNSGYLVDQGKKIASIVDWGNCLGVGFGGLNQDSNAFENPKFHGAEDKANDESEVTGMLHCVPFGKYVLPKLPRQVVADLFNLSVHDLQDPNIDLTDDPVRLAMLKGFKNAHEEAGSELKKIDKIFKEALDESLVVDEDLSGNNKFQGKLPGELFGIPDASTHKQGVRPASDHSIPFLLNARHKSLTTMISEIEAGKSLDEIQERAFEEVVQSQTPPLQSRL